MDTDERDIKDLTNPNLRVYNFRGYTIFKLNLEEKRLQIGRNATHCLPIAQDCKLMANFLLECEKYLNDQIDDVKNVVVN